MDNAWASSFSINDTAQHCQDEIINIKMFNILQFCKETIFSSNNCTFHYE